jgi:uncharacterized membrane protein
MKYHFSGIGKFLYLFFSKFCHQYAHRSWFLFGEQAFYPLYLENNSELKSITDVFQIPIEDIDASRNIIGNEIVGFKVAICQRDVAIYSSLLLFALFYIPSRRKIKKIPIYLWFLFGIIPIGIDGLWQLISSIELLDLQILFHESTPLIRTITGSLFGFFTGWYLFPAIEENLHDEEYRKSINIKLE